MKYINAIMLAAIFVACSTSGEKQTEEKAEETTHSAPMAEDQGQSKSKSPMKMAMANVGDNHVHIEYHAPSKRGRNIFGGLVAYNEVWVTGAHSATSINFSQDVEIGGAKIPSGKYALFTIPGESKWTLIINENWDQHLADDYDASLDVVRVELEPQKLDEPVELLTYKVKANSEDQGAISISWDHVSIEFEVNNL